MMGLETQRISTNRQRLDKVARPVALVAMLINFVGVAVLSFATFALMTSLITSVALSGSFSDIMAITMGIAFTPIIKFFPGVLVPLVAQPFLRMGRRATSAVLLLVGGGLTIPPMVIGGSLVLDPLLASFGVLPFLPHVAGGVLLVAAGALALLWTPPPMPTPTGFAPVVARPPRIPVPEPVVREIVLVVCPFCGFKNPQGTRKCANCGGSL
jgi:hypothetical protein